MTNNKYQQVGTQKTSARTASSDSTKIALFFAIAAFVAVTALLIGSVFKVGSAFLSGTSTASLIITNAKIWTGNPTQPWANSLAVKDSKIIYVGDNDKILNYVTKETVILDGNKQGFKFVVPGFHDSHIHIMNGGFSLTSVDLRDAMTIEEFKGRIANFTKHQKPGKWILEGNWNHENWGGILPTHEWIDSVTPNNPVFLCRLDGHMCLANELAMKLAGLSAATADVEGGEIVKDAQGNPTGILKDNAMQIVLAAIPPPTNEEEDQALMAAMKYLVSQGVTSVHHMGNWQHLETFSRANATNNLLVRIYAAVPLSTWATLKEKVQYSGRGNEWLRIGNLKAFTDGSLGSHTAYI